MRREKQKMINKMNSEYTELAKSFIAKYKKERKVRGIVMAGGVSRGTGDIYSEIDVYFFVKNKKRFRYSKELDRGDVNINGVWFDLHVKDIDEAFNEEWNMDSKWDSQSWIILFQRNNIITKLKKDKAKMKIKERKQLLKNYSFQGSWCLQLAELFIKRQDLLNAHLLVNYSIDFFVNYYFILNNLWVPFYKWKYYYFQKLKKPSKEIKRTIFEALRIANYSEKELWRRIKRIKAKIIRDDMKAKDFWHPHKQDINAVNNFKNSIKQGVVFSSPFKENIVEKFID